MYVYIYIYEHKRTNIHLALSDAFVEEHPVTYRERVNVYIHVCEFYI